MSSAGVNLFPFFFMYFCLVFYLKSFVIPMIILMLITSSFFVALVICGGMAEAYYISYLHTTMISMIYALGVNNVFVFNSIWTQAKCLIPEYNQDQKMRLSYTWKRTRKALELTQGTTCNAFFCLAYTPLHAIKSVCMYTSVLIFINYLLILVFIPPLFVWYEKTFYKKRQEKY